MKLTDGVSFSEFKSTLLTDVVITADNPTCSEAQETYFKIRDVQNIFVADTYPPSAQNKLLQTTQIIIQNSTYNTTSYTSAPTNSCKGVIHGVPALTTSNQVIAHIESKVPVITACMMGKTETALIMFQETYVPFTIYYRRLEFRCHPHKPESQQCQTCLQLGRRMEVCPKKGKLTVCDICYQKDTTSDTPHSCVPNCINCGDDHLSNDPNCPTKKQADAQAALAAYKRRVQQRPKAPHEQRTLPPPPKTRSGKISPPPPFK
ncbi:hypothetical protein HPB47_003220 [Ixodes persulcatus]|uniref:Uncharacterized protein n=1 Tax=Ixodes persulcatus TaxID=34615 RepID=A0AC60PKN9_IXOPE|nr:hypothetical protein HPB47_003220 [Ixodes persulcatus]